MRLTCSCSYKWAVMGAQLLFSNFCARGLRSMLCNHQCTKKDVLMCCELSPGVKSPGGEVRKLR